MVRLAAFDMDGTLLMPNHQVGTETLDALHRLSENQIALTFATGRHFLEVRTIAHRLGLQGYMITGNGTRIHDREGNNLFSSDLVPEIALEVLHSHWETPASVHVFRDDGWLTSVEYPELLAPHVENGFGYQITPLRALPAYGISKICFCGDHYALTILQTRLRLHFGQAVDLCFSAYDCLEVLPAGTNKGSALSHLCNHLDIDLADCMAFGDAMNDREMLGMVGKGYIMGNALPQLKASLPHLEIIGHCQQQAVAQQLNNWLSSPKKPHHSPE
ncbi:thiamin pyrimidine pyrophosphate hydrolase [Hafnia alvei]|uniref:HMP-PP phosphatase n=1 Tax=Hafnia alvei TaxID=569 RepID=UPI0005828708|nr:HMP-PP phosphatase [Hafnia alvei]KID06981.1 thiamin pyrimidine pyrophosphate hydrolase [Hafnia alvei]